MINVRFVSAATLFAVALSVSAPAQWGWSHGGGNHGGGNHGGWGHGGNHGGWGHGGNHGGWGHGGNHGGWGHGGNHGGWGHGGGGHGGGGHGGGGHGGGGYGGGCPQPVCTVKAESFPIGAGCGAPPPVLDVTAPVIGQVATLTVTSAFPLAHGFLFTSLPPVTPVTILPGCVAYLDFDTLVLIEEYLTDENGSYTLSLPQPNDPSTIGNEVVIQTRVWFAGGPYDGDHASNAVLIRAGCVAPGGEGCTPGYWKQSQHFARWNPTWTPNTLFSEVFDDAFPGKTLLQVLQQGGGGLNALGRHTVAALLNAAAEDVSYDLGFLEVIQSFNAAYPGNNCDYQTLKDLFQDLNEQGCPCR